MEQIKLDIVPAGISPVAHASQFDNGRQIRFNLFNQGTPYTLTGAETVTMVVNGEEENITNTSDNYVIWDVAEENCAEVGVIGCEIRIVLGSMLIGSKNFFLEVEMDPYDGKNIRVVTVGPADICTFETTLPEPLQSVIVDVVATQPSGTPTPSTPLPITGYSSANITRCGVNLVDISAYSDWDLSTNYVLSGALLKRGTRLKMVFIDNDPSVDISGCYFGFYDSNYSGGTVLDSQYRWTINSGTVQSNLQNLPANGDTSIYLDGLIIYPNNETTYNKIFSRYKVMVVLNDVTPTTYAPYNGQTYAIAFGQTVYGGVLDVTRGKLTVNYEIVDLSNTSKFNFTYDNISKRWQSPFSDIKVFAQRSADVLAEEWEADTTATAGNEYKFFTVGGALYFYTSDNVNKPEGNLVYPLKTPIDIDLTPEVISAIVGENNVFAGCGRTTVKYLAEG